MTHKWNESTFFAQPKVNIYQAINGNGIQQRGLYASRLLWLVENIELRLQLSISSKWL